MEWAKSLNRRSTVIKVFIGLILLYVSVIALRGLMTSFSSAKRDRVTMVFYGDAPVVLSLGLTDNVSYILTFDNSYKVKAVGGYGEYKIGSLEKLASLTADKDLLRRTFSSVISSYVDYYFTPSASKVYFDTTEKESFTASKSHFMLAVLNPTYMTNANLFERLFMFINLLKRRNLDFIELKTKFVSREKGSTVFDEDDFFHFYQGFFYEKIIRDENEEVKIVYKNSYSAAKNLSRILEGEGMRVVDISKEAEGPGRCQLFIDPEAMRENKGLFYNKKILPYSAEFITSVYTCRVAIKTIDDATIKIVLGDELEKKWR
ncbi:MAG: hypothetical protein ACMG6E_00480 [Candidatus Roizmanbacteria bacterium]